MKNILLLINMVAESICDKINRMRNGKPALTLLALSMDEFTNESWLHGIFRQGRVKDYFYYYNQNS